MSTEPLENQNGTPAGKLGCADFAEGIKSGGAFGLAEISLQVAADISQGVSSELEAYPVLIRAGLAVALRLSVALIEERGSIVAGLRFFAAWLRARLRQLRKRRK